MKLTTKKRMAKKREAYFIATKYRNEPVDVSFFTKDDGTPVPAELVEKRRTKEGVKFFAVVQ